MKILISDPNLAPHRDALSSALPTGCTVVWLGSEDPRFAAELAQAEVLVSARLDADQAAAAPQLRLVHAPGAGVDGIDQSALPAQTILANTFHHEDSIAEQAVASAVVLRRHLISQDGLLRKGTWASSVYDPSIPPASNLRGARVGFIGFGHIGRRSWELFRAFGCTGSAVTGSGNIDSSITDLAWHGPVGTGLPRLLTESDIVLVSAPLNEATSDLIGAAELDLMASHAIVINVGRGPILTEDALYESLADNKIGGAALDVWYQYPDRAGRGRPAHRDFESLPNTLLTPHSSGVTRETFAGRAGDIAQNIGALLSGEPLINVVKPDTTAGHSVKES